MSGMNVLQPAICIIRAGCGDMWQDDVFGIVLVFVCMIVIGAWCVVFIGMSAAAIQFGMDIGGMPGAVLCGMFAIIAMLLGTARIFGGDGCH